MAIKPDAPREERRMQDSLILVERRKGKFLFYGQTLLFIGLATTLLWLVLD